MASRAATATIKGYYYQFDTTILSLLKLTNTTDFVEVEGIEDIDITTASDTTAVQCKYLTTKTYTNSTIREPLILMLDHFVSLATPNNLQYKLYAHFENETPGSEPTIDLARVKDILTYKENKIQKAYHLDNGISDSKLSSFLMQFTFEFGKEFDKQQLEVISKLKKEFGCSDFEADTLLYNNALRLIVDRAKDPDIKKRKITKADFIKGIDVKTRLFSEWYIQLRTKKEYLGTVKTSLTTTKALLPSKTKCIIIGDDLLASDNSECPLETLIENLITKYYKMGTALHNAKPILMVLDCDNTILTKLKKHLIANEIYINDGYEHIEFNATALNRKPVVNTNPGHTKLLKSSFLIKIISYPILKSNKADIETPQVILHFSKAVCPYLKSSSYQLYDVKYCENLKDISTLIL